MILTFRTPYSCRFKGESVLKRANIPIVLFSILFPLITWAADLEIGELTGAWEFMHWAESDDPDNKHKVGIIMDFQSNGTVISRMPSGDDTEHYKLEGNTIIYSGKHGDEVWKIVSFTPGKSLVVNHAGAIMSFERR
jgi:hypothetical protein